MDYTTRSVLTIIERKLRANEPLNEYHRAFMADRIHAMLNGANIKKVWGLSSNKSRGGQSKLERDFRIVEYVNVLIADGYSARTAFYLLEEHKNFREIDKTGRESHLKEKTIEAAYYKTKDSPEYAGYLKRKAEPYDEPDYLTTT